MIAVSKNGWVALATFAIAAAGLAGLGAFPLLDVDEPRFATASRTMLRSGDWIVPWFNGMERFDKPILVYWLQAAAMALFGQNEFAARLPSALSIAASVPAIAAIGSRFGLRGSLPALAGTMVATCAVSQALGRGATADALLLACTAWCAKFQIDSYRDGRLRSTLAAWLFGAFAFLAKGPPALVAPLALWIGTLAAGQRPRWTRALLGAAIATGVVSAWAIPALVRTEGRFWTVGVMHHVVDRSLVPFEGHGGHEPWWYLFYVVAIPAALLPWSAFLPVLFCTPRTAIATDARDRRVLACWFGITALVFTIATSKLAHYPLPGFPPLVIAIALAVQSACSTTSSDRLGAAHRWTAGLLGTAGVLLAAALIAAPIAIDVRPNTAALLAAATFGAGFLVAALRARSGRLHGALCAVALTAVAGFGQVSSNVAPRILEGAIAKAIHADSARLFPSGRRVFTHALSMPSLVFYLDREIGSLSPIIEGESAATTALRRLLEPDTCVIADARRVHEIRSALDDAGSRFDANDRRVLSRCLGSIETLRGFSSNKGKVIELAILGPRQD